MRRFLPLLPLLRLPDRRTAGRTPCLRIRPSFAPRPGSWCEQVTVKDKSGKPIEGLTAKDFAVTENGIPQTIAFLEFQKLEEIQPRARADGPRGAHPAPGAHADRGRASARPPLRRPPPAGALLRHDGHASRGPVARHRRRAGLHSQTDDARRSGGHHGVCRRRGDRPRGLHRRPRTSVVHAPDHDRRRRRERARTRRRRRVRPKRRRVRHLPHRSPAFRAADRREDAGPAQREEVAHLLRQRPAPERHRQSRAAARHHQRGHARRSLVLHGGRARPGRAGPHGRRHACVCRAESAPTPAPPP